MPGEAPVYLSYTQAELDKLYDQRQWAPNAELICSGWRERGEAARWALPHWRNIAYGPSASQRLDVFLCAAADAPVHIHVHGGRWMLFGKADVAFMAPAFVAAGMHLVAIDFSTLAEATLAQMVEQVRDAIRWVHRHAREFGGNPDDIHLSAHSSGAHLAAAALACAGMPDGRDVRELVRSAFLVSGIYDLRPVILSSRRSYVRLERDEADALSPIRHAARMTMPTVVAWGGDDNPEFRRQSQAFHLALTLDGGAHACLPLESLNHFEIADALGDAGSALHSAVIRLARAGGRGLGRSRG